MANASDKSEIVAEIPLACADERTAVAFLEAMRGWDTDPCCPRCGDTDVYQMKDAKTGERNRRWLWRCRGCKQQYTVRIGTVFEDSRIPLRHWCFAFWSACASKKGVSALQLKRQTGLSYKSALFMMHRIRFAMSSPNDPSKKLSGTVECDETYVGGKPRYKGPQNIGRRGRGTKKACVMAMVERRGEVRAKPIANITGATLKQAVRDHVKPSARIMTDDLASYHGLGREFEGGHEVVPHSRGEYASGDRTTNTVESFFALLKRGIIGVYHNVSKEHLHRYVDEFCFRYNTRKVDDGERTRLAIRGAVGKRLTYSDQVG